MRQVITIFFTLLLVASASGAIWTGAVSSDFGNSGNWDGGIVPTDIVIVDNSSPANELIVGGSQSILLTTRLIVGKNSVGTSDLFLQDDAVISIQNGATGITFMGNANVAGGNGAIHMSGNSQLIMSGWFNGGQKTQPQSHLLEMTDNSVLKTGSAGGNDGIFFGTQLGQNMTANISGNAQLVIGEADGGPIVTGHKGTGILNFGGSANMTGDDMIFGNIDVTSDGTGNISGGSIDVNGLLVGNLGTGILNMTGGVIDSNYVDVAVEAGSSGTINLDGGLIITTDLNLNTAGKLFENGGGIIVLDKNITDDLAFWELTGQFSGAYVYDAVNGNTLIGTVPEPASIALLALGALAIRRRK